MIQNRYRWILGILLISTIAFAGTKDAGGEFRLLGSNWVQVAPGMEFYTNDNNILANLAGNVNVAPYIDLRMDADLFFRSDVDFTLFPSAVVSFGHYIEDDRHINPFARGGAIIVSANDETDLHLGIAGGAEIPIGPRLLLTPSLTAMILNASQVMLNLNGGYWIQPGKFLVGMDFGWNGDDYFRLQCDLLFAF
ncbi:MAG TPA: hypothetical protein VLM37_11630 [Fibrobacteraceae bacterium]|nr:hypothetical protein [Fibrobacteraceae bacterium]